MDAINARLSQEQAARRQALAAAGTCIADYDEAVAEDIPELPAAPLATPKMRYRLKQCLPAWQETCTSSVVLSWVKEGLPLKWTAGPPRPICLANHKSAEMYKEFVDQAVAALLATESIMTWSDALPFLVAQRALPQEYWSAGRPLVVAPLGVVDKKGPEKLRLIWDGVYTNTWLDVPQFRYETLNDLPEFLKPGDYLWSCDLKSGYHHLDMHPTAWPYLGFKWEGTYYIFTQLPFGLAVAPWAFTKLMRQLLARYRKEGLRVTNMVDDFLFAAGTATESLQDQQQIIPDMKRHGLLLSAEEKQQLGVRQQALYLGAEVDTRLGQLRVPGGKRDKFLELVHQARTVRRVQIRLLSRIAGMIQSFSWAFGPLARLYTRGLYRQIHASSDDPLRPAYGRFMKLEHVAAADLTFWGEAFDKFNGTYPLWRPTWWHTVIHTDAAGRAGKSLDMGGWGGWRLDKAGQIIMAGGRWTPPESLHPRHHSTWMEMEAVARTLESFNQGGQLANQNILLCADNQAATYIINKGGSADPGLHEQSLRLFWYLWRQNIQLKAEWIPRSLNELADALSKLEDGDDWMLNPQVFRQLDQQWGPCSVDLFASHTNHQVPKYFSRLYTPDTSGVNAFAQDWGKWGIAWCNPPFKLIGQVLRHAKECKAQLILITPLWPSAIWWHELAQPDGYFIPEVQEVYRLDSKRRDLFLPGKSGNRIAQAAPNWAVVALRVDARGGAGSRVKIPV